ncbi:alpha/beta hydrolase family protein [Lysobacter claricitrinus]|uniref:alpha/beta hydrolase family protein n=1 Tax=Lysobacter claricitrinus TaxID=3367728 RepID=UPI0037DBECBC
MISHGNGGGVASHVDLALALAQAGFVVAAPQHPGDSLGDASALASPMLFVERGHQVRATIDALLTRWPGHARIDQDRIGAYGFSAGGFTVLTLLGAHADLARIAPHCAATPEFVCDVLRAAKSPLLTQAPAAASDFATDPRVRAAVLVAPGLGFTVAGDDLRDVRVPVQLWTGDRDTTVPPSSNAVPLQRAWSGATLETHVVPGAAHLSFLAPCRLLRPPMLCADPPGLDRAAMHRAMDAQVVAFFQRTLAR